MRASTIDLLCGEQKRWAATLGSNKLGIHHLYAEIWVLNSVYRLFSRLQLISDIKYSTFLSIWGILGRILGVLWVLFSGLLVYHYNPLPTWPTLTSAVLSTFWRGYQLKMCLSVYGLTYTQLSPTVRLTNGSFMIVLDLEAKFRVLVVSA